MFAGFRSRGFRLTLLAFQFLWLNVVVPGHRRGIVALPGEQCAECQAPAAAPVKPCCRHAHGQHPAPSDPAAHCAICFFAARVSTPVVFDFTHPPLRHCGTIDPPLALIARAPDFHSTYLGRGPPAVI